MAEQPEECSPPTDDSIETSSATASKSSTAPPPSREVSRAEAELRRCVAQHRGMAARLPERGFRAPAPEIGNEKKNADSGLLQKIGKMSEKI